MAVSELKGLLRQRGLALYGNQWKQGGSRAPPYQRRCELTAVRRPGGVRAVFFLFRALLNALAFYAI